MMVEWQMIVWRGPSLAKEGQFCSEEEKKNGQLRQGATILFSSLPETYALRQPLSDEIISLYGTIQLEGVRMKDVLTVSCT
jgi:hypothetical protein